MDTRSFGEELAACREVGQVLDVVVRRAAEVVGEGAVLSIISDDGTLLVPAAFHHDDSEVVASMRAALASPYPRPSGLAGRVAARVAPLVLDAAGVKKLGARLATGAQVFAKEHPIKSLMIVPLVGYGEVLGTLGVARIESAAPYDNEALLALEALADRAALAIADARRAPQVLSAADYRAIFEHCMDGVLFNCPDGRILAANPAACALLQRSEREICKEGRAGIVVDDDQVRAALGTRAKTGRVRAHITMRRGDGHTFVADVSSVVFSTQTGEVRACVIFREAAEAP